ncbi:lysylphosphatidylglycerol synthase domain-containing protein [Sphingomonas sp. AOB5]|uniref:lysylphosphatidylglycerol synthase domain-containing protein n=1 Tax=Sphingomonas sp. AOB5 TaxID=3034017 RepID=UPI0023F7205D|nr:lysylphosphatidylglycerol synthase domain-containing protein [Sphingomonas sp. AOB5]MDF7777389.1 lysylphosphatidylglycerol synthase domain-containing protein [Sphingomonas sp. AOB5]
MLALALALLLVAHFIRAARQANLFAADERPRTIHLMVGLSIAYVINAVLPFRLGEAARGLYVAMRANLGVGRVLATILAERLSDLVAVFAALLIISGIADLSVIAILGGGIVAIVAGSWAIRMSKAARRLLWLVASLFNDRIRIAIADLAWSTVRLVASTRLIRPRYLALTAAMWAAYLAAYATFARATGYPLDEVIATMVDSPLRSLLDRSREMGSAIIVFTSLAALLILVLGLAADWRGVERSVARVRRIGLPLVASADPALRNAFVNRGDYGAMLRAHFTDSDPVVATFGMHGLGDAIVHRILPGGSDAITAVVEVEQRFGIRKFANGAAAAKLVEQAEWLDRHAARLPLAEVAARSGDGTRFRYDMPYHASARDLYEVAHTAPPATCLALLETVVEGVATHHAASSTGSCAPEDLVRYVDEKIVANARQALDFARLQLPETYRINGESFSLAEWAPLLNRDALIARFAARETAAIHGDLTFENIIICPDRAPGWYLIDPNPENRFNSPLIDWAKLMQSLHLGYETINRGAPARLQGDEITLMLSQSNVYAELLARYRALLAQRFEAATLREIQLHEIVNYLRLIPYKIRNQPGRALSFFACASLLLRRFDEGADG